MSSIKLNLYCDEIKETNFQNNLRGNEQWAYLGFLIVPTDDEEKLVSHLLQKRCGNLDKSKIWDKCPVPCDYHIKNNKEVHYHKSDSADVFHVADRWMDFMLNDLSHTYFYILGLNLKHLDYSSFGKTTPSERFQRIYNRFFRMAILKSVKSYFYKNNHIIINSITHDDSSMKNSNYFPWHSIFKIDSTDPKINFLCNEIEFISSDHRISNTPRSHLIQYIDLILGSTFNALHWASENKNKTLLALKMSELLQRLINAPNNINSRYGYVGKKSIDFFPKHNFRSLDEWEKNLLRKDSFYKKRELRVKEYLQPGLF